MNTLVLNQPSHSSAFLAPLSMEALRQRVPAAFADSAHESRSSAYTFISTATVADALSVAGFCPVEARQALRARSALHARHLIRFRRRLETVQLRDAVPEILFLNSHDGTSAYQLRVGLYRAVCTNGLVVSEGTFPVFSVAHRGDVVADVVRAALQISERFEALAGSVERMERTRLDQLERIDFAAQAAALRFHGGFRDRSGAESPAGTAPCRGRWGRSLADVQRRPRECSAGRHRPAERFRAIDADPRHQSDPGGRPAEFSALGAGGGSGGIAALRDKGSRVLRRSAPLFFCPPWWC